MPMVASAVKFKSTAFADGGDMPRRHTCEGQDLSPPLAWSALPDGTRSVALIVDDPDAPDPKAPQRTFVHWVLYDIPVAAEGIPEGHAPHGAREGRNDFGRVGYGGPCPPAGRHRYVHKLYALDIVLGDLGQPAKADLERAMQGHILAEGRLVGMYQKERP